MHSGVPDPSFHGERPLANPRPFAILAGVAAIAVGVLVASMLRHPGMPAVIANDYMRVAGGLVTLERQTDSPAQLASEFVDGGPALPVPDLSKEGYRLDGATEIRRAGEPAILAVYHNDLRDLLVYHAWRGDFGKMPATSDVREQSGRTFLVHRKSTNTLVFWRDAGVVRVVTSSLPTEQVVKLAMAAAGA